MIAALVLHTVKPVFIQEYQANIQQLMLDFNQSSQ